MKFIKKHKHKIILISILALAVGLRFVQISAANFWRDEAFSIRASEGSFSHMVEVIQNDTAPPLFTAVLFVFIKIFGISEFWLRIPSLVAGVASIIVIYQISKLLFRQKEFQLLAVLFASIQSTLVFYSIEARSYAFLLLFASITLYYVIKAKSAKLKNKDIVIFAVTTLLGLYTHNLFLFIAFVNFLVLLKINFRFKDLNTKNLLPSIKTLIQQNHRLIVMHLLVGLAYLPWFVIFISQADTVSEGGFWLKLEPIQDIRKLLEAFFRGENFQAPKEISFITKYLVYLGIVIFLWGIIEALKSDNQKHKTLTIWLVLNTFLVWLYGFQTSFFYIRYLIYLVPAFIFVLVVNLSQISNVGRFAYKTLTVLITLAFLIPCFYMLTNIPNQKAEMTALTNKLNYQEGDLILHANAYTHHAFNIYSDYPNQVYNPEDNLEYYQGLAVLKEKDYYRNEEINGFDRVWLIYLWDSNYSQSEILKDNYTLKSTDNYTGNLHLQLWTKNSR